MVIEEGRHKVKIQFYVPEEEFPKLQKLIRAAELAGEIDAKGAPGYTVFFNWTLSVADRYLRALYLQRKGMR